MTATIERTFKIAPIGVQHTFRVLSDRIEKVDKSGDVVQSVPFADVESARWSQSAHAGKVFRVLDLVAGETRMAVSQATRLGAPPSDPELGKYLMVVRSALDRLGDHRSDLEVEIGAAPLVGWTLFIGYLVFAGGAAWGLKGALSFRKTADMTWLHLFIGGILLVALILAVIENPWRAPKRMPAQELLKQLMR